VALSPGLGLYVERHCVFSVCDTQGEDADADAGPDVAPPDPAGVRRAEGVVEGLAPNAADSGGGDRPSRKKRRPCKSAPFSSGLLEAVCKYGPFCDCSLEAIDLFLQAT
jgi:hypothetical protein